ncbi:alpha/beta hydrolase family protein [Hylemonella sp. W303a]|uniref:alpha/beta hydrolase family protein n=1 Tax=Hylemonella sp. W303a TaxID=3389873 RepID=UPI00396AFB95
MNMNRWVAVFLVVLVAIGVALWVTFFPTPHFPQPTGPHPIGTKVFQWTDVTRPEPFTADSEDRRRLTIQVWYPANTPGTLQPYIDQPAITAALAERLHLPAFVFRNIQNAPTHAVTDAQPAQGRFPVLINPTGFSGFRNANLFWIEHLVSHGYVVVGMDQPGTAAATVLENGAVIPLMASKADFDRYMPMSLSDNGAASPSLNGVNLPGGIIPYLAQDMSFVLDQIGLNFPSTVDPNRAGIFGMSLGGYIAAHSCLVDERFRACLAVDSGHTRDVVKQGLTQPLAIISRDADVMRREREAAGGWSEAEIAHTVDSQRALFSNNRGDAFYLSMNQMFHINWTDAPIWTPIIGWFGLSGPVDPYRGFAETNAFTLAFFDRYLRPDPSITLSAPDGSLLETKIAGSARSQ